MDKDIAKRLVTPKSPALSAYSHFWEEQLRMLDTAVSTSVRLNVFSMLLMHDLRKTLQAAASAPADTQDEVAVLAALSARQTEVSMALARRLTFLRRENARASIRIHPDLATGLAKVEPPKRDVLFGDSYCQTLHDTADKVQWEQTLSQAEKELARKDKPSSKPSKKPKRASSAGPSSSSQPKKSKASTPKPPVPATPFRKPAGKRPGAASTSKGKGPKKGKRHQP